MLHKKDSQSSAALAGAVFSVYPSRADALAGTNAISVGGVSSWTTDASGNLVISGLRYSNWANGATVTPGQPGYQSYWLVETKAPSGYELLAQPVETTVTSNDPSVVTVTINNVPHNAGFQLPLTGCGNLGPDRRRDPRAGRHRSLHGHRPTEAHRSEIGGRGPTEVDQADVTFRKSLSCFRVTICGLLPLLQWVAVSPRFIQKLNLFSATRIAGSAYLMARDHLCACSRK